MFDVCRMQILYALARYDECDALGERLVSEGPRADRERTRVTVGLLRAIQRWDVERGQAQALLRESVALAERLDVANFVPLLPTVAATVAAHALRLGLSVDFIKRAIQTRRLPAPLSAAADWPWPLRIRILGMFVIDRDGKPMVFTGKAQQKPLELLKYLACERVMTADARAITNALWPDADGEGARKNLEVTISRLRKLLDDETLVLVKEGRVSLDAGRVTSDARELVDLCNACEAVSANAARRADAADLAARLLALFVGLPLEHDEGLSWRDGTRERYRSALVRAVRALAGALEESGQSAQSIALIETTIAREPLAESLYQVLMRAYIRLGEHAEAMRVYRQCRQMLSVLIGAAPSAETERVKESIHPPGEKR
jgi:DNA-binding SARP family transcriptional activator